ncbi:Ribonuclease HI [Posidoniimonas polymericola]|uniref:Ribonuclease HI n=1 Tax=Posidoniimonas polymericola TaxID=2528002 RepID=A0A5C5XXK7_9BACT|nr:RNase H family protein [Posidoniimonas polymericola]TWT67690.1 Ribonuclease HI [Posidoniimonas polymericola]
MLPTSPSFLLQADALCLHAAAGEWRFTLTDQSTGQLVVASDTEPGFDLDRLALLALVRGLEAVPRPGQVTVLTSCRTLRDGLRTGLAGWKSNGWKWERFGRLVTIRDVDLWQRVDQALQIHQVQCRSWRVCVADHTGHQAANLPARQPNSRQVSAADQPRSEKVQPTFAPRPAGGISASFLREPALLVVRSAAKRNRLRLNLSDEVSPEYARASAS